MSNSFFSKNTEDKIKTVLRTFMENVLKRRLIDDPWDYNKYQATLPFHVALVPEEIWKGAKFERSFVTSLGMIGWEEIARIIAEDKRGFAKRGERIIGKIYKEKLNKIHDILRELEHEKNRKPNWNSEINEIDNIKGKELIEIIVVADLYIEDIKTKEKFAFEIKSPKPNSDQTKASKDKIFQLLYMVEPKISGAFFALPFNPYGVKEKYNHPHPFRWFNMNEDKVVIMAEDFWNLLGGEGSYQALIKIFEDVGETYKERIKKEYLKI